MSISDLVRNRSSVARTTIAAALLPGLAAAALAAPSAAQADAQGCSSFENVCIAVFGGAGQNVTIEGWAESNPFHGHFDVSGPNGLYLSHADDYWDADAGDHDVFTVDAAAPGNYCVSGYDDAGNYQGAACETVK